MVGPDRHGACITLAAAIKVQDELMSFFDLIQWPAMLVTVVAAWHVASRKPARRRSGFWLFIVSNILWILWGIHTQAYALIALQLCLAVMNIRGDQRSGEL